MLSPVEYPQATSNQQVIVRVRRDPITCDSTSETASVGQITDNRTVVYPNSIKIEVNVISPPPEPREKKPRPIRKPEHQAPLREIQSPWQAKWRLTQQRPRDGLR